MIHKGYMPSLEQARTLGQSAAFQSGRAALAIDGDWTIGTYSATKGIKVGYAPQPAGPKGSWSMYNGLADAIWVGTKHKPEAVKWVQLPGRQACQSIVGTAGRRVPGDQVRGPQGGRQAQARTASTSARSRPTSTPATRCSTRSPTRRRRST